MSLYNFRKDLLQKLVNRGDEIYISKSDHNELFEDMGCKIIGMSAVVFESTVYPGVTEDICIPILGKESGMKCGEDFKVGYSPDRQTMSIESCLSH